MELSNTATAGANRFVASTLCRKRWTSAHVVAVLALVTAGVLATLDAWADIVHTALVDEEQSHALLVPVIAAWLVWVRRERLRKYVPEAQWAGPALIALGWALHRVGDDRMWAALGHLGAILVVVGGFVSVAGGRFLVRFLPAFAALLFLIPVPGRVREEIALPLQQATAQVTQCLLETLGTPVERFGSVLRVNDQDVMIAEACNGLRMVFALVLVSFAFAYGVPLRNGVRVAVIVLSPITAIAFNVVRLVPVVWAFGFFPGTAANVLHAASGWVMLPCAFLTLLGLMRLLRWAQIPITPYVLSHGA